MTELGRLGAFITKVKKGSLADVVGHLRAGKEIDCTKVTFLFVLISIIKMLLICAKCICTCIKIMVHNKNWF